MYKRKTKLSPIHISLIALAILVVIAVIVTFAVKKDEPKEPTTQSGIVYDLSLIHISLYYSRATGCPCAQSRCRRHPRCDKKVRSKSTSLI